MRFNFLARTKKTITNHEGARAYTVTPETELYFTVATPAGTCYMPKPLDVTASADNTSLYMSWLCI